MGKLDIDISKLTSRIVKSDIGKMVIKPIQSKISTPDDAGGIIGWVMNGFKDLEGFVTKAIDDFMSAIQTVSFWVKQVTVVSSFLYNFNWNMTDEEMDQNIKSQWDQFWTQVGGTAGRIAGWLACGVLPGLAVTVINPEMSAYIMSEVAEEALDDVMGNLHTLLQSAFTTFMKAWIIDNYKNTRKFLKDNAKLFTKVFGNDAIEKVLKTWGSKGSQPWSFAIQVEKWNESLPEDWQNPVEEFREEFAEACQEAMVVAASAADRFMAKQLLDKKMATANGGDMKYIKLTPDRKNPEQNIILAGQMDELKPTLIQTMANYQILRDKDVGIIWGTPPQPYYDRRFKPQVVFVFKQKRSDMPSYEGQKSALSMELTLRLVDKSESDFADDTYLKTLANKIKDKFASPVFVIKKGNKPFKYDDDKWLKTQVWGESEEEAKKVVEQILDIVGDSPDWEYLKPMSPVTGVPTIPKKVPLFGEIQELPVFGKPGTVYFEEAYLLLYGYKTPISLVDLTGRRFPVVNVD